MNSAPPLGLMQLVNHFTLWHDLNYCKHDSQVANTALKAMERHFWYSTEECVMFSLLSNRLSSSERQVIAQRLLRIPQPLEFEMGFPTFPFLTNNTKLTSLIKSK